MVHSTWSMWMIFRLPALTWRKQVQSFPLLLRTLLSHKYFIYWKIIEGGWVWCEELCRSRRSMPSIGYCLHRPPNMVTMWGFWGFSGGTDNQKTVKYWINNIESLWHFPISLPCFYLNHFSEKGVTTKWFLLVKPFKYVAPQCYSPCATDLQLAVFLYFL